MKILAFSDTHGDTEFEELKEAAKQCDMILCLGDITEFGSKLKEVLDGLDRLGKEAGKPVVLTHGNHDGELTADVEGYENIIYLHLAVFHDGDTSIIGYGGGGFAEHDPHFLAFIKAVYEDGVKDTDIWIFHGPPHGLNVDEVPGWGNTGCMSKRAAIKVHQPTLVLCGHIHECDGNYGIEGDSLVVNAGENGVIVDLDTKEVKPLQ